MGRTPFNQILVLLLTQQAPHRMTHPERTPPYPPESNLSAPDTGSYGQLSSVDMNMADIFQKPSSVWTSLWGGHCAALMVKTFTFVLQSSERCLSSGTQRPC